METANYTSSWTAADLRAERARKNIPIFTLGVRLDMHPNRIGLYLNERRPLTPRLAARIAKALGLPPTPGAGSHD